MKTITVSFCTAGALMASTVMAAPTNRAGGEWTCDAGSRLLSYAYPYGGSDYGRALVHLSPYAEPTPQGYAVRKEGDNKVTGATGDGTAFVCTRPAAKKKK